jgi:hypothetical protein
MAFVSPKDRVMETSISNSQTVFALAGAIDASFNRFSASMSVGDTTVGAVVEPGVAFRTGVLTYSATNQITIDSTGFESKGTFSSGGTKEVFMGLPAAAADARIAGPLAPWTTYTPVLTADSGSITSYGAAGAYKIVGKTCHFRLRIAVYDNGTGAGGMRATLPSFTTPIDQAVFGREIGVNGAGLTGHIVAGVASLLFRSSDNTYPPLNGTYVLNGTVEIN